MFAAIRFLLLVFGLGFLFMEIRRRRVRVAARVIGSVFSMFFLTASAMMSPYYWALHLESKWRKARPATKAELEACLSLYTKGHIQPSNSLWGHEYKLGDGERMTQYRLLYLAPLDVVYRSDDRIVAMYTSYE
jgi:hypothetical protein